MKKIILSTFIVLLFSCESEKEEKLDYKFKFIENQYIESFRLKTFCGYTDPINEIEWLNKLCNEAIANNEELKYAGHIWLFRYEQNDIAYTDMLLEQKPNGLLINKDHFFDCSGNVFFLTDTVAMNSLVSYTVNNIIGNIDFLIFQTPLTINPK